MGSFAHRNKNSEHIFYIARNEIFTSVHLLSGINPPTHPPSPLQTYKPSTKSLCTVSTISSNYRPPLIDVNNSRRKLVNGEHNRPGQKAKHGGSHSPAGASRRRRLGCCQAQGRGISPQISIYHLNHISLPAIGRKNGTTEWRGKGEAATPRPPPQPRTTRSWRASRTRE